MPATGHRRLCLAPFFATLACGPALAQPAPPPLRPAQDVTITRGMPHPVPGMGRHEMRILVSAATGRVRAENAGLVEILDRRAKRQWRWDSTAGSRAVTEIVLEDDDLPMTHDELAGDPDFEVRRVGEDRVAGLPCALWRIRDRGEPETEAVTLCLSADGLPLREAVSRAGRSQTIEATRVEYRALDPALFAPPQGWTIRRTKPDGTPLP